MSQPTRGDVHVNRPLTNISIAFIQKESDFVADKVYPMVPVSKQSDLYYIYDRRYWFRSGAKKRAPGSESAGGGFELSTDSYFADVWAFHKDIADQTRANADIPINMDRDATQFVTNDLRIRREKEFVDSSFKTGVWGSDPVPTTKWDAPGSDPVDDVLIQKDIVKEKTGFMPNTLTVTPDTHRALKNNASILDRIKHTQFGSVTEDILARLFEVDRYMVARATEDQGPEGGTENMKFIFGTASALLSYAAPNPGLLQPSAGYHFAWTGLFGAGQARAGGGAGMRIKRFRMEAKASDRVEGEWPIAQKVVASELAVFFNSVLT